LHISNNREVASNLLVNHKSKNTHHGSTSVVQLDGTLGELGLFIKGIPSKVNESITEISNELVASSWNINHNTCLQETDEEEDLRKTFLGNRVGTLDGRPAIVERTERVSSIIDVAWEVDASTGDDVTQEGELGDAAVLDLDGTKAIETGLVGIVEESEGVEETEGGLGTELGLEGVQGRGGLGNRCGSEGGGRSDGGGEDDGLHGEI
ncbi:hypothetical protein ACHAXR_013492, partial [Thalassiosira sp. AJA248-18]